MYKTSKVIILILAFAICISLTATKGVAATQLNQLVENAGSTDGKTVTVMGEAIGELMERGDYAWININDGTNAMGIWLKLSEAQKINFFGDYKYKGDIVEITGIFNKACTEHGGDVDIHCSNIKIIENGYSVQLDVHFIKIILTVFFIALAAILAIIYFKAAKKSTVS